MNAQPAQRPNPWPIAIVAYFIVFITFIAVFITFAVRQKVDLVSHDYYAEEIHFQKHLDEVRRAQPVGARVAIDYDSGARWITLTLPAGQIAGQAGGKVRFYRPSDARLDREVVFAPDARGVQRIDVRDLRAGLWKIHVQWMVAGQEFFYDQPLIMDRAR